jgi:hypothetical protein
MAITKIQSESLNLADTYAFTGTVTGAGVTLKPAFSAYLSANQSVSDATWTKVQCNTEVLDSDSTYDNSSNYRFTPASTGYYLLCAGVDISCTENTMVDNYLSLYKNGSQVSISRSYDNSSSKSTWRHHTFNQIINCTSTSDYYEIFAYADPSSGSVTFKGDSTKQLSYFNGFKLF